MINVFVCLIKERDKDAIEVEEEDYHDEDDDA